jgi:hypothetical protein
LHPRPVSLSSFTQLQGTPVQNQLGELWSLLHFLDAGKFGDREGFLASCGDLSTPEARAALHAVLRPHMLRRTKEDVMKTLPAKHEVVVPCPLTPVQAEFYRMVRVWEWRDGERRVFASPLQVTLQVVDAPHPHCATPFTCPRLLLLQVLNRNYELLHHGLDGKGAGSGGAAATGKARASLNNILMELRKASQSLAGRLDGCCKA